MGYFPELECVHVQNIRFKYNGIRFDNFYLYKRPDLTKGQTGID